MIKQQVLDLISSKYQILDIIDLVNYDENRATLDQLEQTLAKYCQFQFDSTQRILIFHHDTDYYISNQVSGFMLHNLFVLLDRYKLPQEFFILFTNHYGIEDEVKKLSYEICNSTSMKVIYTALWYDFPTTFNYDIQHFPIKKLFCCLNGVSRIHRLYTLCCMQENNLLGAGIISYHFDR